MKRIFILLALIASALPLQAQSCPTGKLALVLSGGGAKGLAHIGVIRVLDSLGIRPDLVVGSSMGAIVGGMYASGYTGREIDSLARALPLSSLVRTYEPRAPLSLGPVLPLAVWEQGDAGFALQSASVREAEVNALANAAMLRGNLLARGNFDALPIPFRAVATDLATREPVVLAHGDLAEAVRASFAIPLIFAPERIGGRILADGGLSANIPIAIARAEGATRVIVSNATEALRDPDALESPIVVADRLLKFLFLQPAESLTAGDVLVRPSVDGFTSLNFSRRVVDALIARGVAAADSVLKPNTCAHSSTPPKRSAIRARIAGIETALRSRSASRTLLRNLGLHPGESIDPELLRIRLREFGQSETYRAVWLNPRGPLDSLTLHLHVRPEPRRILGLGLAYDNELGGRMWVGLVDRNFLDHPTEATTALYLGELRRELYLGLRQNYQLGRRFLTPAVTARLAMESVRQFDPDGHEIDDVDTREAVGFLGVERSLNERWLLTLGAEARAWHEPGKPNRSTLGAVARMFRASRAEPVQSAEIMWTGIYRRIDADLSTTIHAGQLRILPRLRAGWGTNLPIQLTFPLGGDDGMPGLHLGERRGDREAFTSLAATYPILGPINFQVEAAAGRSAIGGFLLDNDNWIEGIRAGIAADTPVGPVRVAYGVASNGRDVLLVRFGRWF